MNSIFPVKGLATFCITILFCFFINNGFTQIDQELNSITKSGFNLSNYTPEKLINKDDYSLEANEIKRIELCSKSQSQVNSLSIAIIESQSINSGHIMDLNWQTVASNIGHTATIYPQTLLDNSNFFSTTDVLIVSSGVIEIPQSRRQVIQQWVEMGKPLYIQGEYQETYQANQTFQEIVNNLGGSFLWGATFEGDLNPMNISGVLSTTPNTVTSLSYFWYGAEGTGNATIEPFMEKDGHYFGFIFTPPNPDHGVIIANSDQDWVNAAEENELLMENIITYFSSTITGLDSDHIDKKEFAVLGQNSPNPFNSTTEIKYSLHEQCTARIDIYNMTGQLIKILLNEEKIAGDYSIRWDGRNDFGQIVSKGIYYYTLMVDEFPVASNKMILGE